ncbi:hypothetical protein ASE35_11730 [Lysobacter sp. Root916]|uniref:hypothetical protein n=1 Tax=Lysobacter sp. Root916 TaxID=1736606 RepID=UPI00070E0FDF|nr:hypothetical protein [Lysobacter sp. Root916]KRD34371.1 hypothetical protein ASE35_11730 [Lysobacter sp. Root916]
MDLDTLVRGGAGRGDYSHLLPFAWMLPTYYAAPAGKAIPSCGAPLLQLPDPDLQARAQRLLNVLYWTAQRHANLDGMVDEQTLKVFLAPEFLFRKGTQAATAATDAGFGAYPESLRHELAGALYSAINGTPLFKNWLLVAGSLCASLTQRRGLLNTTFVLRGQRAQMDASPPYVLLEKLYRPRLDDAAAARLADADQSLASRYALDPEQSLDNLIRWDGMMLGVELGLDHGQQTLRNDMNYLGRVLGPEVPGLDLQLIASCGTSIIDPSCAVKDGGLVVLADGHHTASQASIEPRFQIGRYDAQRGVLVPLPSSDIVFSELPRGDDSQIDYMRGRYAQLGRRQGVWSCKAKIPLQG